MDQKKLEQFIGKMLDDLGAACSGALVITGDKLGLFKTIDKDGPVTSGELATKTNTAERYVREWLAAMAASGYVNYDPESNKFSMDDEQKMVFSDEESPVFMMGAFDFMCAMYGDEPKIRDAFQSGNGVGWHEHSECLFKATERFFRPTYNHHLIQEWIPAMDGMTEKLNKGAKVADVGCGHGASTIIMGKAFQNSNFTGFDYHPDSIEMANEKARQANVDHNVNFEVASSKAFPGSDYDMVAFFDCLHDMGDPVGAAKHVYQSLKSDGIWMIVEPFAHDKLQDNLNPIGRLYYSGSTFVCTPASLSQEVGLALGAQAGEARLKEVVAAGGFSSFRRATETPFNIVFEAKP